MVGNIVLVFINYSFLAACLISGDNLTWIESASRCILADQQEILTESVSYDASWIGGYHLTTPWVSYLGCFFKIKKLNDVSELHPKSSPAECRFDCQAYNYFVLEDEHCRCLNSRNSLQTTDPQNYRSGKTKKYFQVYKSTKIKKDLQKPRHFNDQRFLCSIIKFNAKANKIFLKAEQCDNKHFVVCQTSEKEFSVIDDRNYTFAEAQQKCKMIDYYSVKDDPSLKNFTIEEKTFWTNIRRFSTQRWVDNTTDIDALKDTMKSLRYQRCLSASQSVGYQPAVRLLPCNNIIPFRCSPEDRRVNTADSLDSGTFQHTTPNDTLISLPYTKAASNSSNTTDINTNWHKWDNEYIDRTRITDLFVTIIGRDNVSKNTEQTTEDSKDNVSKNTEQTTEDSKVSMYAGTAVALTILPISVIVIVVYIRRHRIKVVVTEPAAIGNSDHKYENVLENVNTDYHTLNLDLVGETNDYSTLQPNVPDYIEIR